MSWLFDAETLGSHAHVKVRCGPSGSSRPLCGTLVMRTEEWDEFKALVLAGMEHLDYGDVEVAG